MSCVMVIEDDADIRESIVDVLRDAGYHVVEAADGAEALEQLEVASSPCVILLDLMMPRMDGWSFREKQRQDSALWRIPTVILSGAGDLQKHTNDLEAAAFVNKPFRLDALLDTVRRYCPTATDAC